MAGFTSPSKYPGGSATNYLTGGIDLNAYRDTYTNSKNYMTQGSKDAWNNQMRAESVRESLRPGSMNYGQVQRLPNEGWNEWLGRKSAANDMFGGFAGSGLTNALRGEQGLSSGGSSRSSGGSSRGGGGGGGGGGQAAPTPIEFYLGPAPTLEELNLNYEEMGNRAMEANTPYRQQYQQMAPGTEAGTRALSQAGATMATGQLSRDMTGQIGRGAAALGFSSGLGGRSGIGRNILARDLGLGSLQVQQQGADLLSKSSMLAQQAMQAMSPISPGQVFGEATSQASYNSQIRNQNALNAWQSQALPGQFDISKGQYVGFQPGTYAATRPSLPGSEWNWASDSKAKDLQGNSLAGRPVGGVFGAMHQAAARNWTGSAYNPIG